MVHLVTTLSLLAAATLAFNTDKRCLLFNKKCVSQCPRNMHAYHTKCDGQTKSQRTCDNPYVYILGYTCGWSRCDCSGDLLLNEENYVCIDIESCPKYATKLPRSKMATERRRSGRQRYRMSKRIKIEEDELTELV